MYNLPQQIITKRLPTNKEFVSKDTMDHWTDRDERQKHPVTRKHSVLQCQKLNVYFPPTTLEKQFAYFVAVATAAEQTHGAIVSTVSCLSNTP